MRPWTEAEVKLLGRLSDTEVVERTGHSLKSVQTKRQGMGILVRPHGTPWKAKEDRLLGTKPDSEVATLLKRPRMTVYWRRCELGIKPTVQRPPQRKWTPAVDKLLGTARRSHRADVLSECLFSSTPQTQARSAFAP